jgi:hypothetical protein
MVEGSVLALIVATMQPSDYHYNVNGLDWARKPEICFMPAIYISEAVPVRDLTLASYLIYSTCKKNR